MIVVGLTGNYGMGKSTVARIFRELGAVTIDTDEVVHGLLGDPSVLYEIRKTFGDEVIEQGTVNRGRLADMVFQDPSLRVALEDILHPRVFRKVEESLSKIPQDSPVVVIVEATVIFERGYQNRFDRIITVFAPEEVAISRLKEKGVPEDRAVARLKSQFPSEMKVSKSDFSVDNGKGIEYTTRQVEDIYSALAAQV